MVTGENPSLTGSLFLMRSRPAPHIRPAARRASLTREKNTSNLLALSGFENFFSICLSSAVAAFGASVCEIVRH